MYLGIDCGTQGTKVIIWDADSGSVLASASQSYELVSQRPGQKEQHPQQWLSAIRDNIKEVLEQSKISPEAIQGIGISGQQHGLILLDQNKNIIRPAKLWCDTEPSGILKQFLDKFLVTHSVSVHQLTGIHVPVAFTLGKLLWIKHVENDAYHKIDKMFLPHEFINYWLTGNYCAEYGDASGTGYFDTYQRCWCKEVIDVIDPELLNKLPPLIESHQPCGYLLDDIAQLLGLPAGIPVSSGGGDNMMSAIGTGNIDSGILTMSLGTSGTLFTHSIHQIKTENFPDINAFCSSSGGWLPLVSTMNVTNVINAFRNVMDIGLHDVEHYLHTTAPGAGGLTCYPWLNGSRLPNRPDATASIQGMTTANFTKANLLRCAVEGVTFKLSKGIEIFQQSGLNFSQLRVIGGGANSLAWCQMIADITGIEVIRPKIKDAGALGAALQAQWCVENNAAKEATVNLADIIPASLFNVDEQVIFPRNQHTENYKELYRVYHDRMPLFDNQ